MKEEKKEPELSIVIVTWNSEEVIKDCLDSVYSQKDDLDFEVLVVDNDSYDDTKKIIRENFPQVDLITNKENSGYSIANNQGVEKSKGEFVLLLNPDVKLISGFLLKSLDFMKKNPEAGALGPQLLNPDGSIQPSCREFPGFSTIIWELFGLSYLFPESRVFGGWRMGYFDHSSTREVPQPMGSALLLRKRTLDQIGTFGTDFKIFFSDVDLCKRICDSGWKIYFYPEAKAFHLRGSSTGKAKPEMIFLSHLGFFKFLKKYKKGIFNKFLLIIFGSVLFIGALVRFLFYYLRKILGYK